MTIYEEDKILNELKDSKRDASVELHEFCDALLTRLRNEFGLNTLSNEKAMEALYNVETTFTDYGAAIYRMDYLRDNEPAEVTDTAAVFEAGADTEAEAMMAMATFLKELRKIGLNTSDVAALIDDLKKYLVLLQKYGAARMAIAIVSPMDDAA